MKVGRFSITLFVSLESNDTIVFLEFRNVLTGLEMIMENSSSKEEKVSIV